MNKKLKMKFVILATLTIAIIIVLILLVLNISSYIYMEKNIAIALDTIESENGMLPGRPSITPGERPNTTQEMTFFMVFYSGDEITNIDLVNSIYINNDTATSYAEIALADDGIDTIEGYRVRFASINESDVIIFLDVFKEVNIHENFVLTSVIIALIALVLTFIISSILAKYFTAPIVQAYDKQKQFITNASHEIKTPLAIITANMDILEMTDAENTWIKNTKMQVEKLTELTTSLVSLSRMEEVEMVAKSEVDITELSDMAVESFNAIAKNNGMELLSTVEQDLIFNVNEQSIGQLIYILLDNAFKYSKDGGVIKLKVSRKQNKLRIIVKNPIENMHDENCNDVFDRFYRGDKSRNSNKSGFGIGLALAKAIVESHKGKINAKIQNDSFYVEVLI